MSLRANRTRLCGKAATPVGTSRSSSAAKLPCAAAAAAALASSSKPPPRSRATLALIGDAYATLGICAAPYRLSLPGRAARFERRCRDRGCAWWSRRRMAAVLGARVRDHRLVPYQAIGREALDRIEALLAVRGAELWDVV
jgi:hypothetical protein